MIRRILCTLLCVLLFVSLAVGVSADASDSYRDKLLADGFPASYLPMLTTLHEKHPSWEFEAVNITQLNGKFTWEYVIRQMMSYPQRNLVVRSSYAPSPFSRFGDGNYSPYRNTAGGAYDSGSFYAATQNAVRYFMDPRNFLNDTDCFMFLDWQYDGSVPVSVELIEKMLEGTGFGSTVIPDLDGKTTYAAYILSTCTELHINPLLIAARLVQESGGSNTPLVRGTMGYAMGNNAYNGLFNYFNVGAGGNGGGAILTGAAKAAMRGSPSMKAAWGGSPSWNRRWKAIYGGILFIKSDYVDSHRNTLYMQKFATDPRGTAVFNGYMQNIAAPLTEGRDFRKHIADALDEAYTFSIPVYSGMPASPSADPGGGNKYYSYTERPASTEAELPRMALDCFGDASVGKSATGLAVPADAVFIAPCGELTVEGWYLDKKGVDSYAFSVDGGEEIPLETKARPDVTSAFGSYGEQCDANSTGYSGLIDLSALDAGDHTVRVTAHSSGRVVPVAVIRLSVLMRTSSGVILEMGTGAEGYFDAESDQS